MSRIRVIVCGAMVVVAAVALAVVYFALSGKLGAMPAIMLVGLGPAVAAFALVAAVGFVSGPVAASQPSVVTVSSGIADAPADRQP